MAKSVLVVEVVLDLVGFECVVLFHVTHVCLVVAITVDMKVEMELVKSWSSWILAIVATSIEVPDMSNST